MHWHDSAWDRFEAKIRISHHNSRNTVSVLPWEVLRPPAYERYRVYQVREVLPLWVGTKKGRVPLVFRCVIAPHALVHPLGDVGLQPDDWVRTNSDLLGELTCCHPSVDGGETDANAIQGSRTWEMRSKRGAVVSWVTSSIFDWAQLWSRSLWSFFCGKLHLHLLKYAVVMRILFLLPVSGAKTQYMMRNWASICKQ